MSDCNRKSRRLLGLAALAATLALPALAPAQTGKIVCWKDKSGKIVGCGDTVPPEFQGSGTKELDSRGVTRRQTESVEEAARRREREQQLARSRADDDRKALEQKRQDTALLETFSSEREIDLKRDRDLQVIDMQIEQFTVALKNTTQRYNDARSRADMVEKNKKPLPATLKEELSRVSTEKGRFEQSIQAKQREKDELRAKYAEYRKRFGELRAQQATATAKK